MKVSILLIALFLFTCKNLQAQTSHRKIVQYIFEQPEYNNAQVGIQIADANSGNSVYALNNEKLLIPASVLKLVTSAAALEILGSDYRFLTRLGYSGKIKNGVLYGDLIIIGGGDPALGSEYFTGHYFTPHFLEVWAKRVKAEGISRIEGRLITDNTLYNNEKIPPTWIWEDMGNYYGAGTSALTVYDNLTRITFQSPPEAGSPTSILSVYPRLKGIHWENEVLSSDIQRDLAYVFGSPHDNRRIIRGTIPGNRSKFTIKASNPHPEKLIADEFLAHLASAGVFITGSVAVEKYNPKNFFQIASVESPPLSEIIKVLNSESVNLFAEHLVCQIAAEETGMGDREAGLKIIADHWASRGLDVSQLFMEDGSGLSHFNAVSPQFITSLLISMKNSGTHYSPFFESLPSAGNGTLNGFNRNLFPFGSLSLKSGSMKRVRCYAGYIKTDSGNEYAIAILVNHFSGTHAKLISELEKLFAEVKKH
jgi:serine-type D-Ala-D-Ala carboxypeptidase/endopeptidase (penicillin-binding protein 4)